MANEQQKGTGAAVILRDRYLIYPASPLPELNSPTAAAYLAEDRRDPTLALFALIIRPGYPARVDAMRILKGVESSGFLQLYEWGTLDWPLAGRRTLAVVYERPTGGRVATSLTSEFKRVEEMDVVRKVIIPIASALRVMQSHSLPHRAIRTTNMFWMGAERDRVVLGECCTAPPAYDQPVLVETIESGLTMPAGRGKGGLANDFYSFGAALILLVLGRNPVVPSDDAEAIIRLKIIHGSYFVLAGEERLPLAIIEILRGLLCDDPHERWNSESLELWLAGRRLAPLLAKTEKRVGRGFPFAGKEYASARELAIGLAQNWDAALSVVTEPRFELWLRRSLEHKEMANAVAVAVQSAALAAADKKPSTDLMLAKVCLILDSAAPLRYKELAVMPDGIGTLLAMAMADGRDIRILAEMLMRDVVKSWFETRDGYNPDNSMMEGALREQRGYLERGTIGNGTERVLYELNDNQPCLSALVVEDYVADIRDVLPALNNRAKKSEGKGWPMDRHLAAFIAARASFDLDRQLQALAEPKVEKSTQGLLNLLALIQWRLGQNGLLALTGWMAGLMTPLVVSYHSREKRKELEKEIPRIAKEGSLVELARLLDNPEERGKDVQGFEQARFDYAEAVREIDDIQSGRITQDDDLRRTAQQMAALISVTISLITVSLLVVRRLF